MIVFDLFKIKKNLLIFNIRILLMTVGYVLKIHLKDWRFSFSTEKNIINST